MASTTLMTRIFPLLLTAATLGLVCPVFAEPQPWTETTKVTILDGNKGQLTHLDFPDTPNDLIAVHATVNVEHAVPTGLNFFAIQVDFPNNTWAHGGPQFNDGKDKAVNWGGLVDRGGGLADYEKANPAADLHLIQCDPGGNNTKPYDWEQKQPLKIAIHRGKQVTLPPGDCQVDGKVIHIKKPRTMWEWHLTVSPPKGTGKVYRATIHNTADRFSSFCIWNESGYGSEHKGQRATWSDVAYKSLSKPRQMVSPKKFDRS